MGEAMFPLKEVFKPITELTVILSTLSVGISPQAWAWGSYGHQQVNVAAVELLAKLARRLYPLPSAWSRTRR